MAHSPSIVPDSPDRDVYLVLDDFGGPLGLAWRETEPADTELEHLIENLLSGQYAHPVRIVAFNTTEGWSRDVTEDIARELAARSAGRDLSQALHEFIEQHTR
jgi:hypothetical protein